MDTTALFTLSYGVYVATAFDEALGRHTGCVANSLMQVTAQPPCVALSVNRANHTRDVIAASGRFAVSVLREQSDPNLIAGFGFRSGADADKFAGVAHREQSGLWVLDDACAYLVCEVKNSVETSTHTLFVAEVADAGRLMSGEPMTYAYYHRVIKGKTPQNAPTYAAETAETPSQPEQPKQQEKWVCTVCGYVYDGDVPFEQLPDDWRCPICNAPKSKFVRM